MAVNPLDLGHWFNKQHAQLRTASSGQFHSAPEWLPLCLKLPKFFSNTFFYKILCKLSHLNVTKHGKNWNTFRFKSHLICIVCKWPATDTKQIRCCNVEFCFPKKWKWQSHVEPAHPVPPTGGWSWQLYENSGTGEDVSWLVPLLIMHFLAVWPFFLRLAVFNVFLIKWSHLKLIQFVCCSFAWLVLFTKLIRAFNYVRISTCFIWIDSSWNVLQLCFWVCVDQTKRSVGNVPKVTETGRHFV